MLLALLLFALIGVTLGLFGGGGSILTVPTFVYAMGLEPKPAIAMSLLVVGLTSAAALVPHARAGNVRWRRGLVFGVAGMVGAYAGGRAGAFVPGSVLLLLFGAVMVLAAAAMWRGRGSPAESGSRPPRATWKIVADGLTIGAFTGLVGAGGGFLIVPALVLLGGLSMVEAVGTSLLVIALKSLAGFAGYAAHVPIDATLALAVTGAAVVGSFGGALLTSVMRPERLQRAFAGFVLVMAVVVLQRPLGEALDVGAARWLVAVGITGILGLGAAALAQLGRPRDVEESRA